MLARVIFHTANTFGVLNVGLGGASNLVVSLSTNMTRFRRLPSCTFPLAVSIQEVPGLWFGVAERDGRAGRLAIVLWDVLNVIFIFQS